MNNTKISMPFDKNFPFMLSNTKGVDVKSNSLHWHKELEICYVKSGTGKYIINGKEFELEKNDVFIINNDEIHHCYNESNLVMQVILFDPSLIWSGGSNYLDYEYLMPFLEAENKFQNKLSHNDDNINLVISVLHEIEAEYFSKQPCYELMIKSLLLRLMTVIMRHFKAESYNNVNDLNMNISIKIKNVTEYIEENYYKPITLKDLASIAQMSIPYLSSTFKSYAGVSPNNYIIRKRISIAKDLLKNSNKSIVEISGESGFNSLSNFNHIFKEHTGISPSKYKKS